MQQPIPRRDRGGSALAAPELDLDAACEYIRRHAKPVADWRVGIEYEILGFEQSTLARIHRDRVQALLRMFVTLGGAPTLEDLNIIAVRMPFGDITLEPGGQIEFSGHAERTLSDNASALQRFLTELHACAQELGIFFVGMGFDPVRSAADQSWVLKQRYAIMRPYLGQRGQHAWDMMTRTAAMQTSIDYADEEDLGRKYVLGNRLGPIVAAMFANSPFVDGAATGLKSVRYAVWLDTDADRTGPGPGTLEEPFDLRRSVAAMLDVPVFFIERDGELLDYAGLRLTDIPGSNADDFPTLLSMIFTEARIRDYIELRSADGGTPEMAIALAAFWKGLTYDAETLGQALWLAPHLDRAGYRALQMAVARDALDARSEGVNVLALAKELVTLARTGLAKLAPDEVSYLDVLAQQVIVDEVSPADIKLSDGAASLHRALRTSTVA